MKNNTSVILIVLIIVLISFSTYLTTRRYEVSIDFECGISRVDKKVNWIWDWMTAKKGEMDNSPIPACLGDFVYQVYRPLDVSAAGYLVSFCLLMVLISKNKTNR